MELVAGEAITSGIERGSTPDLFQDFPRLGTPAGIVGIERLNDESDAGGVGERGALIGLEDAVFESG